VITRLRLAALVIFGAATVVNAWSAIDAQRALPSYESYVESETTKVASERTAESIDQLLTPGAPKPTPDPKRDASDKVAIRLAADADYAKGTQPELIAVWEHAGKIEVGIVAFALCAAFLLPRKAPEPVKN